MVTAQRELRTLSECELDRISAGRICDQGGTRMEINVRFGGEVLVIWATSGSHGDGVGCSGTYWKVP
jgi:hypothetical protein